MKQFLEWYDANYSYCYSKMHEGISNVTYRSMAKDNYDEIEKNLADAKDRLICLSGTSAYKIDAFDKTKLFSMILSDFFHNRLAMTKKELRKNLENYDKGIKEIVEIIRRIG